MKKIPYKILKHNLSEALIATVRELDCVDATQTVH